MAKLFLYQLRRMLLNKCYPSLVLITSGLAYYLLRGAVILGTAGTAPFSFWSYGDFLTAMLPLTLIALLFLLSFLTAKKELAVRALTDATPVNQAAYTGVKLAAILTGYLLIWAAVIGVSFVFYAAVFRYYAFGSFALPILVTCLPPLILFVGVGLVLGKVHSGLLYALILCLLLFGQVTPPMEFDLFGRTFFQQYPLSLPLGPDGEPAFVLSALYAVQRTLMVVAGAALIWLGLRGQRRRNR